MPSYTAPIKDMQFVLHEVLRLPEAGIAGYADLDADFTGAVLEEAGRFASEVLAPLNAVGDREGCVLENGVVRTPPGFKEAFDQLREQGWPAIDCDEEYGGQGLPYIMNTAVGEILVSANMAFNMYQGLTHGAYSAIRAHGTEDQKVRWLPKLATCEWTGTMNLTEPHAGTDLGMMRTKAEPQGDGTYRITGQKIFISAGDHDMAENIVHLVLAKAPGGGDGTKGISLFIVPKVLVNEDGSLGARNAVSVGKIEEKMGIHGNATCVMNYEGAVGYLLGDLHKGMRAMFTMMNEARLGVGLQGYAQAEVAYQNAAAYAKDRLQGRDITGVKNPGGAADPIIVHPDVRRNLMDQRRPHLHLLGREPDRPGAPGERCGCGGDDFAPDAGHQGVPDRQGVRERGGGPAGLWRARLHRGMGHVPVRPRRADRDDLRRGERGAGARPCRAEARGRRRQARHGVLRDGEGLHQRE